MWFHIDPSAGLPIYLQIYNQVKNAVAAGTLRTGDQLPSVRDLAVKLTINPNTAAKAYQELERDSIIETSRGRGTFIAADAVVWTEAERKRRLNEALDRAMVEAKNLSFAPGEVRGLFEERLTKWFPGGDSK